MINKRDDAANRFFHLFFPFFIIFSLHHFCKRLLKRDSITASIFIQLHFFAEGKRCVQVRS
ncbi:hypothetical protein CHCC14600_2015 [Bacillus licheniformis]|nr:hypothetical protein CHCC20341_4214 [Bacillus licheniformis]TWL16860.1 hypothetical protein CHCC19466_2318 [Bacillus licheniformis]TWL81572.1 hypothetical protein CHCC15291_1169 [Bacillus licheniformis]TWM06962.1 hypothetical protein CHCC15289_2492 [Bacillus licheniformis]TWM41347.1 hypothetical protein CHCC14818_1188 [Bacillus licheniformis]